MNYLNASKIAKGSKIGVTVPAWGTKTYDKFPAKIVGGQLNGTVVVRFKDRFYLVNGDLSVSANDSGVKSKEHYKKLLASGQVAWHGDGSKSSKVGSAWSPSAPINLGVPATAAAFAAVAPKAKKAPKVTKAPDFEARLGRLEASVERLVAALGGIEF